MTERSAIDRGVDQEQYDALVRDAMLWRSRSMVCPFCNPFLNANDPNFTGAQQPAPQREWLVIDDSRKNGIFATEEMKQTKGYIPRDVAEALLGRSLFGTQWFTKEESAKFRAHAEWRTTQP